jgi:EAL domain-containing protein (putative c-di-GMP-specific phosphodiesterase class I)
MILVLAAELGVELVAEDVETEAQPAEDTTQNLPLI